MNKMGDDEMFRQKIKSLEKTMRDLGDDIDVIRRAGSVDAETANILRLSWVKLCVLNSSRVPLEREGLNEGKQQTAREVLQALDLIEDHFSEEKISDPAASESIQRLRLFLAENASVCGSLESGNPGNSL